MEKRINERRVMKEVFEFDKVYVCDECGKESIGKFTLTLIVPENFIYSESPIFCCSECLRKFVLSAKADEIQKRVCDYGDDYGDGRMFGIYTDLKTLREIINGEMQKDVDCNIHLKYEKVIKEIGCSED